MRQYWQQLNEREQWMLGLACVIVLFYLGYSLIYSPLQNTLSNKTMQLAEKRETLAWMKTIQHHAKPKKMPKPISALNLMALMDNQISKGPLKSFAYQLQQINSGEVQLSFDEVPFNLFLSWMWALSHDYEISWKQFNADKTDTPGLVKLTAIICSK